MWQGCGQWAHCSDSEDFSGKWGECVEDRYWLVSSPVQSNGTVASLSLKSKLESNTCVAVGHKGLYKKNCRTIMISYESKERVCLPPKKSIKRDFHSCIITHPTDLPSVPTSLSFIILLKIHPEPLAPLLAAISSGPIKDIISSLTSNYPESLIFFPPALLNHSD